MGKRIVGKANKGIYRKNLVKKKIKIAIIKKRKGKKEERKQRK